MKVKSGVLILVVFILLFGCKPLVKDERILGWNLQSEDMILTEKNLEAGKKYGINQLQLSGKICDNLKDIKESGTRNRINRLIKKAHKAEIREIVVWNNALYNLNYYPDKFKTQEHKLLNLDDSNFWEWLKEDYRKMLKLAPEIDGIVLAFNESDVKIENQYSEILKTPEEKRAALVDSIATVVINEMNLKLYIRNFTNGIINPGKTVESYQLIKCHDVVVMEKESSGDFFVTNPVSFWIQNIPFNVIIEFDCMHENEGQGVVADIFPGIHLERWQFYKKLPNVIGFFSSTGSVGDNTILDTPSEVNLFAIFEATKNPQVNLDKVLTKFISEKYDSTAVPFLKPAFEKAPEIIFSSFYTLGLNTTNHSQLDFDYRRTYTNNVSGRWMDNPVIKIDHGVNREFHYWMDIVDHLAPAKYKQPDEINMKELPEVFENNWLQPEELMDTTWFDYVIAEKEYGARLAREALIAVKEAKPYIHDFQKFNSLYHLFNRTLISARMRKAYAQVYYAQRIWLRGETFQDEKLKSIINQGIDELTYTSIEMEEYSEKGPVAQYIWVNDARVAERLVTEIKRSGILLFKNKIHGSGKIKK
jgi:hypothetical protein